MRQLVNLLAKIVRVFLVRLARQLVNHLAKTVKAFLARFAKTVKAQFANLLVKIVKAYLVRLVKTAKVDVASAKQHAKFFLDPKIGTGLVLLVKASRFLG